MWNVLHNLQVAYQAGWRPPFAGSLVTMSLFPAATLVSVSSGLFRRSLLLPGSWDFLRVFKMVWETCISPSTVLAVLIHLWGGRDLLNVVSLGQFLELFWVVDSVGYCCTSPQKILLSHFPLTCYPALKHPASCILCLELIFNMEVPSSKETTRQHLSFS